MCSQKVLLLNASNMDGFPVYPYAFIQVSAVARGSGIEVICKDLLGVPETMWEQTLQNLVAQHHPAMMLITLRNTDSFVSRDYERDRSEGVGTPAYFPIERTKRLITAIRASSNLKIALGGFGFSVFPDEIMSYLRPDFGVFGGSDGFFAHFENIKAGNFEHVPNLLFFQDDQLISNPRIFYPPLANPEYTPQAIQEMMAFYDSFPSPGFEGAPVEIMRGCCHSCVFCSEPHVAGKEVRYRDLSAVLADIATLADHGITQIHMISSELNPEGNAFVLKLADRIRSFNEQQQENRKVTWFGANYLLNFSLDEFEHLYRSGFTGGWFDITALDDENARAMRTPYRNESLLVHLKTYTQFERARLDLPQEKIGSQPAGIDGQEAANPEKDVVRWTLFLGNPATTTKTVRNTLKVANRSGLAQLFQDCHINTNIRVFDYENPDKATLDVTYSVKTDLERTGYQQLLPSFAYPPALLRDFGSEEEIELMVDHIAHTYLSTKFQETRNWSGFVKQRSTFAAISRWIAALSSISGVRVPNTLEKITGGQATLALQELFAEIPREGARPSGARLAKQVVDFLVSGCIEAFPDWFESLGLPKTAKELGQMTPYQLSVTVFSRWCTKNEFVDELTARTQPVLPEWKRELLQFCAHAILYRFNILLRQRYKQLFIPMGTTAREHGQRSHNF